MVNLIQDLIISAVEVVCGIMVWSTFFGFRKTRLFRWILGFFCWGLYFLLPGYTALGENVVSKLVTAVVIWAAYLWICCEGNRKAQIFAVLSYFVMLSMLDYLTLFAISWLWNVPISLIISEEVYYVFGSIASRTVLLVGCYVISRLRKQQLSSQLSARTVVSLLAISGLSLLMFATLLQSTISNGAFSSQSLIEGFGLLILNIGVFFLLKQLERSEVALIQSRDLQHELEQNMKAAQAMQALYKEQRSITHDMNNHIATLCSLLQGEQWSHATAYALSLQEGAASDLYVVTCNNAIVDSVINQKYAQAKAAGTAMRFTINDLSQLPFREDEFVTVLGNLLDNALEACQKVEGSRHIHLKLLCADSEVLLSIQNTSLPVAFTDTGLPITDKTEPWAHGYGLQNVIRILQRHGCEYSITYQKGLFSFISILS